MNENNLTKENVRCVNMIIDINENGTLSIIDNDLNNVGTLVINDGKVALYMEDGEITEYKTFDDFLDWFAQTDYFFHKFVGANNRWHKYNPNPKQKNVGDCSLRAYCAGFGWDWESSFDESAAVAKGEAIMMDTAKTCDKVLKNNGYIIDEEFRKSKRKDLTVNEFAMTHPYGTYFLHTHGHLLCVKNGEYWDSWDSGDKKVKKIYVKDKT